MALSPASLQIYALALLVFTASFGCGRANKVYPERASVRTNTADGDTINLDGRDLPRGFANQSVHSAVAALNSENEIEMKTSAGAGSLAILGLTDFDSNPLSELSTFKIEFATSSETSQPSAVLLVDLDCDGHSVRALFAESESKLEVIEGLRILDASVRASIWKVKDLDLKNSDGEVLVSTEVPGALEKLLASYPKACLRNGETTEESLPRQATSSVMITLGSLNQANTNQSNTDQKIAIRRIEIGAKTFDAANWGPQ